MVVNNSSKINRRVAQTNAARQQQDRAATFMDKVEQDKANAQSQITTLRSLPQDQRPENFDSQIQELDRQIALSQTQASQWENVSRSFDKDINANINQPTNTMALGFNANNNNFNADGTVKAQPTQQDDFVKANARKQFIARGGDPNQFEQTWNTSLKPGISDVLNNSGKQGVADVVNSQQAEFDSTKGYVNKFVKGGVQRIEDPAKTAEMKAAVAAQNQAKATTIATAQETVATQNKAQEQTSTMPTVDPLDIEQGNAIYDQMLSSLPAEQQAAMAPLFEALKAEYTAQLKTGASVAVALEKSQTASDALFAQQKTFLENLSSQGQILIDNQKEKDLLAEEELRDKLLRDNEYQRLIEESKTQRLIRDSVIAQEETAERLLMQNGLGGGWRSSMKTASVLKQLQKGEQAIQDMKSDAILHSREYVNKAYDIEKAYTSAVRSIDNNAIAQFFALSDSLTEKAIKLDSDKTISNAQRDLELAKLEGEITTKYAEIQSKKATAVTNAIQDMYKAQAEERKFIYDKQQDLLKDTYKYIDVFGTSNREELRRRERLLDVTPGTFSNTKTLAEMKKTGSVYGGLLGVDLATELDTIYQISKDATGDGKVSMDNALYLFEKKFGSSKAGGQQYYLAEKYINEKYAKENGYYATATRKATNEDVNTLGLAQALLNIDAATK